MANIDGNTFVKIKEGDEDKKILFDLRNYLYAAQFSNRDIKFVYTYRYNDDKSVNSSLTLNTATAKTRQRQESCTPTSRPR